MHNWLQDSYPAATVTGAVILSAFTTKMAIYALARGAYKDKRALTAAYDYLILGTIGATFFVIGIGFLYMATGTLNLVDLADRISDQGLNRTIRALALSNDPLKIYPAPTLAHASAMDLAIIRECSGFEKCPEKKLKKQQCIFWKRLRYLNKLINTPGSCQVVNNKELPLRVLFA